MSKHSALRSSSNLSSLRRQIDALDEGIRNLIVERRELARRAGEVRGEGRDWRREADIKADYVLTLGPTHGLNVANAVLGYCRRPA